MFNTVIKTMDHVQMLIKNYFIFKNMCAFRKEGQTEIRNMSEEDIREEATRQAHEIAQTEGLEVGTIVGFADPQKDGTSYNLLEINGDTATIGYENKQDGKVRKIVPLRDLVDVNLVRELSEKINLGIPFIDKGKLN